MITTESDCVDCGFRCNGSACPHYEVYILTCDDCGEEVDELYEFEGEQLCIDCILKRLNKVNVAYYN